MTWKEYDLIQPTTDEPYRREITWNVFNEKANRFANMLLSRGVKKGDKVAILMYNCLNGCPSTSAPSRRGPWRCPSTSATPPRRSSTAPTWRKSRCWSSARSSSGALRAWRRSSAKGRLLIYVGDNCPTFAESYRELRRTAPPPRPRSSSPTTTTGPSTSPRAPRASPRPSYISTAASPRPRRWSRSTTRSPTRTPSCASRPCTTPGPSSTGWGSLFAGSRAVLLKGTSPEIILKAISRRAVHRGVAPGTLGPRISWTPWTGGM